MEENNRITKDVYRGFGKCDAFCDRPTFERILKQI